ncbi:MAG: hypothetical protein JWN00_4944, partial [Actinomycetia bacterium]|nr:hypothetical protein [Actinomycetes bacterium]
MSSVATPVRPAVSPENTERYERDVLPYAQPLFVSAVRMTRNSAD